MKNVKGNFTSIMYSTRGEKREREGEGGRERREREEGERERACQLTSSSRWVNLRRAVKAGPLTVDWRGTSLRNM